MNDIDSRIVHVHVIENKMDIIQGIICEVSRKDTNKKKQLRAKEERGIHKPSRLLNTSDI